jgi:hypothetical protein
VCVSASCVACVQCVLREMPKGAWLGRERDVMVASRGCHARQGRGRVVVRHGEAGHGSA